MYYVGASWFFGSCRCFFGRGVELCSCIGAVVGSGCFRLFCGFDIVGLLFGCLSFSVVFLFFGCGVVVGWSLCTVVVSWVSVVVVWVVFRCVRCFFFCCVD